jgi:hypothetical protein
MSEWWTYTLSDFLLFSPKTYYRLFELYNRDLWPGQVLALALGVAILVLLRGGRQGHGRIVAAILAGCWAWIAWAFHYERYATINWAAAYFAAAFAIEALLMFWTGVIRGRLAFAPAADVAGRTGCALVLFAVFVQPLLGPAMGREWVQAEIFGVAPDPTVVATLGVLAAATKASSRFLLIIPVLWCGVSGAFLWAMQAGDALVLPLAGLVAVLLAAAKARRGRAMPPPR